MNQATHQMARDGTMARRRAGVAGALAAVAIALVSCKQPTVETNMTIESNMAADYLGEPKRLLVIENASTIVRWSKGDFHQRMTDGLRTCGVVGEIFEARASTASP